MNEFYNLLAELSNRLNIPQPAKSRIILEIAADLEDTFNLYLHNGMSREEAVWKTREKFDLSDEAVQQLVKIHSNPFRLWLDRVMGTRQTLWEKALFSVIFMFLIATIIRILIHTPFFSNASGFIYPIITILIFTVALWIIKFYQLYIKNDHNLKKLRYALPLFKLFTLINLFLGLFGYFMEIYLSRAHSLFLGPLFIMLMNDTQEVLPQIINVMLKNSALMLVLMLTLMLTAVFWLNITYKINIVEQAEAAMLLDK